MRVCPPLRATRNREEQMGPRLLCGFVWLEARFAGLPAPSNCGAL
jgi:hypothetical protein